MDEDLHGRISALVEEEHELRARRADGSVSGEEELSRLRDLEMRLDQCWDLLRQRNALREAGGDAGQARVRPPDEVEGYLG
jgi:hypothetical protein